MPDVGSLGRRKARSARTKETRRRKKTHERHRQVPELVPKILDGVESDECGDEEADPFDTEEMEGKEEGQREPSLDPTRRAKSADVPQHATNRETREHQPEPPVIGERADGRNRREEGQTRCRRRREEGEVDSLVLLIVKVDEPKHRRESEKKQHRVQQDKPRDRQPSDVCTQQKQRESQSASELPFPLFFASPFPKSPNSPSRTINVTRCTLHILQPKPFAVYQATGTIKTP